jgi:hypothetical protein
MERKRKHAEGELKCDKCKFVARNHNCLEVHKKHHNDLIQFKCEFEECYHLAENAWELKMHKVTHENVTDFKCTFPHCNYVGKRKKNLISHLKSHTEEKEKEKEEKSIAITHPHLQNVWCEEKNGPMSQFSYGSCKQVFWRCLTIEHHIFPCPIGRKISQNIECTICSNTIICSIDFCNSLWMNCNDLLKEEWDEKLNGSMKNYMPHSRHEVHWICRKSKHKWEATINARNKQEATGCPLCNMYKSEECCTELFEEIFQQPFIKTKSLNWLKPLELDGYCEIFKVAFEYQGVQHRVWTPYFHKTEQEFFDQQARDKKKQMLCKENGVILFEISDEYKYTERDKMREYIIGLTKTTLANFAASLNFK